MNRGVSPLNLEQSMTQLQAAVAVDLLGFSAFMIIRLKSLCIIILLLFLSCSTAVSQSIVETLPGYPGPLPFKLETGYIGVDEDDDVQLFYYFIESEGDPMKDPLLLWITGGPGCSGFSGLVYEIGPLNIDAEAFDGNLPSLVLNPYSWTKVASIIFVDSPAGTGFSYANTSEGSHSTDTKIAEDIYVFLRKWLLKHPNFIKNRLYIAGDSYGAMWVPMLVWKISKGNEAGVKPRMALEGYSIGNPKTDDYVDANSQVSFANRLGLLSDDYYKMAETSCNGDYVNPSPSNAWCLQALQHFKECVGSIYAPNILESTCKFSSSKPGELGFAETLLADESMRIISLPSKQELSCRESAYILSSIWANKPAVQEALQVRKGAVQEWKRCNYDDLPFEQNVKSVLGYHHLLSEQGYKVLVYSGDHDMVIPYIGTLEWIRQLNLTLDDNWRPWLVDNDVAGYTERYVNTKSRYNLTFATVKGAGHTAPEYKRKQCLAMFVRYLSNFPL